MAKYNTMHDIPYLKFMEFSHEIKDHSDDAIFIADKVIEYFYPEVIENEALYVEEFAMALNKNPKRFVKYLINLRQLNKADNFIDADTFNSEHDYGSLLKLITRPLWWFGKVDVNKISLSDGQNIMQSFLKEQSKSSNLFNIFLIRQLRLQLIR